MASPSSAGDSTFLSTPSSGRGFNIDDKWNRGNDITTESVDHMKDIPEKELEDILRVAASSFDNFNDEQGHLQAIGSASRRILMQCDAAENSIKKILKRLSTQRTDMKRDEKRDAQIRAQCASQKQIEKSKKALQGRAGALQKGILEETAKREALTKQGQTAAASRVSAVRKAKDELLELQNLDNLYMHISRIKWDQESGEGQENISGTFMYQNQKFLKPFAFTAAEGAKGKAKIANSLWEMMWVDHCPAA